MNRCRKWYARLLRLYPGEYRRRFGQGMEQTFHDLCREHSRSGRGLFRVLLWTFLETFAGALRENADRALQPAIKRGSILLLMNQACSESSATALRRLKYAAVGISVLMMAGIITLMILARGKGEDIAGIVAMALMITVASGVVAAVAAVLQRRVQRNLASGR